MKFLRRLILLIAVAAAMPAATLYAAPEPYIQELPEQQHEIAVHGHRLDITVSGEGEHQVVIYALTGQVVKQLTVQEGTTSVELMSGYYIVRVDKTSQRIVIR